MKKTLIYIEVLFKFIVIFCWIFRECCYRYTVDWQADKGLSADWRRRRWALIWLVDLYRWALSWLMEKKMSSHLIGGSLQMSSQLIDGEENELSSDCWRRRWTLLWLVEKKMNSHLIDGVEDELSSDWWIFTDELLAD